MRHNFIWGIADDVLRDLYVRGKYRDVILPMMVLRRLDAILEPTKKAVIEMKAALDARKLCTRTEARFGCREARAFLKTNLRVMLRKRIPRTPVQYQFVEQPVISGMVLAPLRFPSACEGIAVRALGRPLPERAEAPDSSDAGSGRGLRRIAASPPANALVSA